MALDIRTTISNTLPHFLKSGLVASFFNAIAHGIQLLIDAVDKIYNGASAWSDRTDSQYSGVYYELAHNGQKQSLQNYLNAYILGITDTSNQTIYVKDNTDNISPLYIYDDASVAVAPETYARYVYNNTAATSLTMYAYAQSDYVSVTDNYNFIISVPNGMADSDIAAIKNKVNNLKIAGVKYAVVARETSQMLSFSY